jgi:pimeloyl-ACP methyl ester carboxylesterase
MNTVTSRDGTTIAYERSGDGPPLILVDGALCSRAMGPSRPLAKQLERYFTVYDYDRRGRNESGDTAPYDVAREVEDLEALIAEAGGEAYVYGISSGAALTLEAARRGAPITKLALYEAPVIVDDSRPPVPADFAATLEADVSDGRRGEAVKAFMRSVGAPRIAIALMRVLPVWRKLTAVAHTLPYDFAVLDGLQSGRPLPAGRWDGVAIPALVVVGGKSPGWFHTSMRALADAVPNARHEVLDGQNHMVKPKALAPLLTEFFGGSQVGQAAPRYEYASG